MSAADKIRCARSWVGILETRTRSPGGFDRGLGLAELVVLQAGENQKFEGRQEHPTGMTSAFIDLGTPQAAQESRNQRE